jgi:hypothetical protein
MSNEDIKQYPHDAGWKVPDFDELQWLYITCPNPKCGHDWSIVHLGVSRNATITNTPSEELRKWGIIK